MTKPLLRRLTVLKDEATATPVPTRKFFHLGRVEDLEDVGTCIPMISWVDDNLSRYVLSDVPSSLWGRQPEALVITLPNVAVRSGDGVCVVIGAGNDESEPHPAGKTTMHFVHLGLSDIKRVAAIGKLYVYRLDGVQVKGLAPK